MNDGLLNRLLNGLNGLKLVVENAVLAPGNELLNLGVLKEFIAHLLQQPVLVVHLQLILELRPPMMLSVEGFHSVKEGVRQVILGDRDALYLLEGACLLLSAGSRILERLIFGFDAGDLSLNFLLPTVMLVVETLVGFVLELTDLIYLSLLLYLKQSLFNCLGKEYVENGLDFTIVIEKVVVFNLSDFIYTGLFGNVRRRRRSRHKIVRLAFNLSFLRASRLILFSQEISEIDLNASGRTGSQVIRRDLVFGFLEFNKLALDHLDLFLFSLGLDAQLLFLHGR